MIVKGIGDSGVLDEGLGRTEVLLEVRKLDELEREAELETIVKTEKPDEVWEVNEAVEPDEVGGAEEVECVPEDDEADALLLVLLLLDILVTGWDDDDLGGVTIVLLLLEAAMVGVAEDVACRELFMLLVVINDVGADMSIAKDDEDGSIPGVLDNCDSDENPELPISRADEAENPGLKLLASALLTSEFPMLGVALFTTLQLLLQLYNDRVRKELLTGLKWLARKQAQ
ncbi:hypothetical protein MMC27_006330 [Xylographa pallens]|nr:hypothetical protein [Xylographa pallens]